MSFIGVRRLVPRLSAILATGFVMWLPVSPAHACPLTEPSCRTGPVGDAAAADVAPADDVTSTIDEVVGDVTGDVEDVVEPVEEVVRDVVDEAEGAVPDLPDLDPGTDPEPEPTGGDGGGPRGDGSTGPGESRAGERVGGAFAPALQLAEPRGGTATSLIGTSLVRNDGSAHAFGSIGQVIERATRVAFPMLLIVLVALFVVVQHRIDSRDPKLALSPLGPDDAVFS